MLIRHVQRAWRNINTIIIDYQRMARIVMLAEESGKMLLFAVIYDITALLS